MGIDFSVAAALDSLWFHSAPVESIREKELEGLGAIKKIPIMLLIS